MTALATLPGHTDLYLPLPSAGAQWDPHLVHAYYFGFCIPEAQIGCFYYLRCQPAFPLCGGGVSIFHGTDNHTLLDAEFFDYELTMPWPDVSGQTITTANGLTIDFVQPGREVVLGFDSGDGRASLEIRQTAMTPLVSRSHVFPAEELERDTAGASGGMEQLMHATGTLMLDGETYEVDCHPVRDRSWNQLRPERRGAMETPPVGWTPMYFGPDLAFAQVGIESIDTDPAWIGVYDVPIDRPAHHFGFAYVDGELRALTEVRRNVLEYHPDDLIALRQDIEARDEAGETHRFHGEAIALCPLPAWPNILAYDSVYRWEAEDGRVTHCTYQEMRLDTYQRALRQRRHRRARSC